MSALDIAIKLITKWEGCKLEAYQDEKGIWTIGIGTTGSWVKRGVKITQEKAEELLKERVNQDYEYLKKFYLKLNDNQYAAILSFMYNVGRGNFVSSSLFTHLKKGDYEEVSRQFLRWKYITVNGIKKVSNGLLNRRIDEKNLFLKPV